MKQYLRTLSSARNAIAATGHCRSCGSWSATWFNLLAHVRQICAVSSHTGNQTGSLRWMSHRLVTRPKGQSTETLGRSRAALTADSWNSAAMWTLVRPRPLEATYPRTGEPASAQDTEWSGGCTERAPRRTQALAAAGAVGLELATGLAVPVLAARQDTVLHPVTPTFRGCRTAADGGLHRGAGNCDHA